MLLEPSLFGVCLRGFFGSSIFVIVVLAGSFGFLMIWSLIICSRVMWSTCLGLRVFCGWNTICCRWLNSFLMVMLLKLKSELVEVSIVVCVGSAFWFWLFLSHDVKHSWFFVAEKANLSMDSILRKHVAQIFFGNESSSSTYKRKIRKRSESCIKTGFSFGVRRDIFVCASALFFRRCVVISMLPFLFAFTCTHGKKSCSSIYEDDGRRGKNLHFIMQKPTTMQHKWKHFVIRRLAWATFRRLLALCDCLLTKPFEWVACQSGVVAPNWENFLTTLKHTFRRNFASRIA